jgi:hypothetical protein
MKKIHDYLDFDLIKVEKKDGAIVVGTPISVLYADESPSGKDELNIENAEGITGLTEKEIKSVEVLK